MKHLRKSCEIIQHACPFIFQVHDYVHKHTHTHTHIDTYTHIKAHTHSNISHRMQRWSQKFCHNITYAHQPRTARLTLSKEEWLYQEHVHIKHSNPSFPLFLFPFRRLFERSENAKQTSDRVWPYSNTTLKHVCVYVYMYKSGGREREREGGGRERESFCVWEGFRRWTTQYQHSFPPLLNPQCICRKEYTHTHARTHKHI